MNLADNLKVEGEVVVRTYTYSYIGLQQSPVIVVSGLG